MKRKSFGFYMRIYCKILAQDIKSKMSYRADFIISTIGMIFTNIAGFVSFWILFRSFPSINGWSYYEMLFLYGFSLVSLTPVQCFFLITTGVCGCMCIRVISLNTVFVRLICFFTISLRYLILRDWDSLLLASVRLFIRGIS